MSGLDPQVVKQMMDASDNASHAQAKGELFEQLLKYVFESVPGTLVRHNSASFFGSEQIDLAVANRGGFPGLPDKFLVECKNYSDPVDSKAVGYFLYICVSRSAELAVIVASNGLTGDSDELTHAHSLAMTAQVLKCRLVVLTRDDLLGLADEQALVDLLEERHLAAFSTGGIGA